MHADICLKMVKQNNRLAVAQDSNGETALGMLAKKSMAFSSTSEKGMWGRLITSCKFFPFNYLVNKKC